MSLVYEDRAYELKYTGQKVVQRLSIHQPGCDIYAQADPSHGYMPDGSALSVKNEKMAVLKKQCAKSAPYTTKKSPLSHQHLDIF
ncbi:hypothetical protein T08_1080, partial [Trichinella sp. T8]